MGGFAYDYLIQDWANDIDAELTQKVPFVEI
jgi:hypothetical protein